MQDNISYRTSGLALNPLHETKHASTLGRSGYDHTKVLLHPHLLHFLETNELVKMPALNKEYARIISTDNTTGYWSAMCASLTGKKGIYAPQGILKNAKAYFFEELWARHSKWQLNDTIQDFKIRVSTRFRPGEKSQSKLALPLHQFLKVRRRQLTEEPGSQRVFVGEIVPEHMQDALLGTIMQHPVRLQDSGMVLDRSVAVSCVLRGGKDPFTGSRLTMQMLEPMPDLAAEIAEFKSKQAAVDITVAESEVMGLVEDIDPKLLEALVALEQLNCAARRADIDSSETIHQVPESARDNLSEPPIQPEANDDAAVSFGPVSAMRPEEDIDHHEVSQPVSMPATRGSFSRDDKFAPRWRKEKNDPARIIDVSGHKACVTMQIPGTGVRPFYFNMVFPGQERQVSIYNKYARDIVVAAINGQNGCLLCYGQTSSGKTFTMFGPPGQEDGGASLVDVKACSDSVPTPGVFPADTAQELHNIASTHQPIGIVLRSCAEIMRAKTLFEKKGYVSLTLTAQYVEVYSEVVTDLMSGQRVSVRRSNGELHGAQEFPINELSDIAHVLTVGNRRKHFAATAMNDRSSRSHTALVLHINQSSTTAGAHVKSCLYLVDLAGSERVKKSKAEGIQMLEARAINASLLVLGKVISRLSRSQVHIPYYESQLTTLLKGAFGGNCRTGVIVTCRSDDAKHGDETLQSLRFGELCGMISNSTIQAATSADAVLECLEISIAQVSGQIEEMIKAGRQNMSSFHSLNSKFEDLKRKRDLIAVSAAPTLNTV